MGRVLAWDSRQRCSSLGFKRHASTFRHRISRSLVPTSKQKFVHVAGQEMVPSQQLLLRAGMMRQSSSGIYSMLPFGLKSLVKIEAIIDEELEDIGCQKLAMPNMLPAENWKKTGRWETAGPEMFKLKDRKGAEFLLAPTHEEEITTLIGKEVQSYRQLPIRVYQVTRKFRDELRARSGLLRGKEFLMKDLYTFDVSEEEARKTYDEVVEAYRRIMTRLGVPYAVAEADTGNIGGSHSHEFHILSRVGEDSLLSCSSCGYTSNEERAVGVIPEEPSKVATKFRDSTDLGKWVESLDLIPRSAVRINPKVRYGLLHEAEQDGSAKTTLLAVATAADRQVNEIKMNKALGKLEVFDTLEDAKGALGEEKVSRFALCVDQSLFPGLKTAPRSKSMTLDGALPADIAGISCVSGSPVLDVHYGDFHNCLPGDGCPHCATPLSTSRAIEVGHTFLLGTKYSAALDTTFMPATGTEPLPFQMGCYGLGITRLLASIIEASHDHRGIQWPESVAPYRVVIVTSEDEECIKIGDEVYDAVQASLKTKSDVIIDDRLDVTLGFKMKDAELIGYPWMVVVGKGYLRTGNVEVQHRLTGEKHHIAFDGIAEFFAKRREVKPSL
ncbi:hypothetical protein DFQ26_002851 [Actinomortierella ambigua]|nr:hypothetical protein DFQ26_002851 [Actinomortierella ambigua]